MAKAAVWTKAQSLVLFCTPFMYVQLRSYETAAEHVYEGKWGHFDMAKSTFKMLLASWNFYIVLKGFRSFNAENLKYVGQRAAKLPAIKLWEWFDRGQSQIRADWFKRGRGRMADFFLRPSTLKAGNFEALQSTDPLLSVLKDLNLFKIHFNEV